MSASPNKSSLIQVPYTEFAPTGHQYLFSLNIASGRMRTIGDVGTEFAPKSFFMPGIRFSLAPDGNSILYPTFSGKESLWILDGFAAP